MSSTFSIGKDNILTYNFNLDGIVSDELVNIFKSIKDKKKYYKLKNNSIIDLENNNLNEMMSLTDELDFSDEEIIKLIDTNYQDSKMIKGLRFKKDGSFYNTAKILSSDQMDDLIIKVDDIINECINKIIQGNFSINPKIIANKNYSCPYCKFKDICYKQKDDEIKLGEYDNEVDS